MTFFPWLRENGLLSNSLKCHCCKTCALSKRSKTTDGYSFRCSSGHQFGMRKYSFLQGSSYDIRDLLLFIKKTFRWPIYLHQSASSTGMEYHHTYVDWTSYEFVFSTYKDIVFDGDVEIDNACSVEKLNTTGVILPEPEYGYLEWYNEVQIRE